MTHATRPLWGHDDLRLDPYATAQRLRFEDGGAPVHVTLSPRGAVMRRRLACGIDVNVSLPAEGFAGVAAQAFENADGTCTVTLVLHHADPALCVPLLATDDPEAAAADWRSWARNLRLPMLLAGANGMEAVEDAGPHTGPLTAAVPLPRRRRRTTLKHRPNFRRRRQVGRRGPMERLDARELIARS